LTPYPVTKKKRQKTDDKLSTRVILKAAHQSAPCASVVNCLNFFTCKPNDWSNQSNFIEL